ncbi:hypothetical protein BsWGS_07136 [Bradybaena similaris]
MGQNSSSTAFQNSSQPFFSRRKSSHHPAPVVAAASPEVPPPPKSPTYVVAENKVLPNGVNDISGARKLLRPVSQELSKVHPEYADIFKKLPTEGPDDTSFSMAEGLNVSSDTKENYNVELNTPRKSAESRTMANGGAHHFRKQSISSDSITDLYKHTPTAHGAELDPANPTNNANSDIYQPNGNVKGTSNLLRSQSMGLSTSQPLNMPKHKRQISLASNSIQESVIPEDPREHLYNPARVAPFTNFQPSMTSLPIRNTFDIDYSLNLTYAQLAEFRRNKRTTELEERTGKKLGELEAEISASSNVPKSPFDLQNRGGKVGTHSVSTSSSDTGVSKSKKKKAPAPPPPQLTTKAEEQIKSYDPISEPPPDYDMKDSPSVNYLQQAKILQRSLSSASRSSKPPAPQPFPKSPFPGSLQKPVSTGSQQVSSSSNLSDSYVTLPRTGQARSHSVDLSSDATAVKSNVSVRQTIAQAKAQLEAMRKLRDSLCKAAPAEANTATNDNSNVSDGDGDTVVADLLNFVEKETALNNGAVLETVSGHELSPLNNGTVLETVNGHEVSPLNNGTVLETVNGCELSALNNGAVLETVNGHEVSPLNNGTVLETVNGYEVSQAEDIKQERRPANLHHTQVDQPDIDQKQLHHSEIDPALASTVASPSKSSNISTDKEITKRIDPLLQQDIILAALARQAKTEIRKPISENYKSPPAEFLEEKPNTKTTKEISQHDGIITDTPRSNSYTPQTPEENTVLRLDILAVSKKIVSSKFDIRSWPSNSSQSVEFENTSCTSLAEKLRDNLPQLESSFDPEDRSSVMSIDFAKRSSIQSEDLSIDFPKRSSIQSEDMSISSSNTSMRMFSPDWAPEHDLDSDDDIMDSSYAKTERRVSSEGFKVSIVPPKVRDLNETPKTKKTHKENKKRNEVKSPGNPLSNEKSKFGSLRKFKKNVHQGVKNAFGSISKASGTIVSKQKSQDLHDNSETKSFNRSAEFDNDVSASFRNPNWMLSRSVDESLHRRTLSDGFINQRSVSTLDHSDLSENSEEDDIGDIDFAAGINDIQEANSNSRQTKLAGKKKMSKPTGVDYTNMNGQIGNAENHDFNVNIKNIGDFDKNSRKIHKKGKQSGNEPASRMKEQSKLEEVLAKMIAEKEQQYEIEKLRQQETESNLRRLKDLEGQEMLQRLQHKIALEEISRLQKQQLIPLTGKQMNSDAIRMSSLGNLSPQQMNSDAIRMSSLSNSSPQQMNGDAIRMSSLSNSSPQQMNSDAIRMSSLSNLSPQQMNSDAIRMSSLGNSSPQQMNSDAIRMSSLGNSSPQQMNSDAIRMSSLSNLSPQTSGSSLNNSALNSSALGIGFNNDPLHVSPLNNLGGSPSAAAYINDNQLPSPSTYLANGNAAFLQTGNLGSPVNFQNSIAASVQQGYNMPSLSTAAFAQPISPVGVTNTNYMLPLVSGTGVNNGITNKTVHNLTQQELVYLGEYMRMIGVPPPANNHEWALLLNTVSYNMSSLPMVGQNPGPITFPLAPINPNLSSLLVNKNSFIDHTPKLTLQIVDVIPDQQSLHPNKIPQILHNNESTPVLPQLQNYTHKPSLNSEHSDTASNNVADTGTVRVAEIHPQPAHSASTTEDSVRNIATKTATSVNEFSTPGEDQASDTTGTTTKSDSQSAISETFPKSSTVSTGTSAKTYLLPAKVYAPLGFRPVSFNPSPR